MTADLRGDESPPDTTPVQLTRMEGVLNLINHQLSELIRRVDGHETRIGVIELSVQRLGDAAVANERTVEQTAKALKDAKEATEAQARSERQKDETSWTPVARLVAVMGALSALVAFYFALRPAG